MISGGLAPILCLPKIGCMNKPNAQQRFASMATSGFSCGKSAAEWNVLLYL